MNMTTMELQEELTQLYKDNVENIAKDTSELVNKSREKAFEDFKRIGLPTKKDENYKYTDLLSYLKGNYSYEISPSRIKVNIEELFKCDIPELDTHLILAVNGFYYQLNNPGKMPKGVIIDSFAQASLKYPEIVNKHYGQYADTTKDSLATRWYLHLYTEKCCNRQTYSDCKYWVLKSEPADNAPQSDRGRARK